jgi:hypothetical protein
MTLQTMNKAGGLEPWGWVQAVDRALGNGRLVWTWVQVPLAGALKYGPSVLLALPAAYASAQFSTHHDMFPQGLGWAIGVGFEWLYLGTLAMSGSLRDSRYFRLVNLLAVLTSITYVTLWGLVKYGVLGDLDPSWGWSFYAVATLLAVVHAAPLAGLNFLYNSLIHQHDREQAQDQQAQAAQQAHSCPDCGWAPPLGHRDPAAALNGHKRHCKGQGV